MLPRFSGFQRALWYVDETEARWQALKRDHRKLSTLELVWSKKEPSSFAASAERFAQALGVSVNQSAARVKQKLHLSSPTKLDRETMRTSQSQDATYRHLMGYSPAVIASLIERPYRMPR